MDKKKVNQQEQDKKMIRKPDEKGAFNVEGHIKIFDPESGQIFVNKRNAIHYENMSIAMASSLSDQRSGYIYQMAFGNGGTYVDPTGIITYLTPNTVGINSSLYNQTFVKVVDGNAVENKDPIRNNIQMMHTTGNNYTDIIVSCLLDYGEPTGQGAFDNATGLNDLYTFDELGLVGYNPNGSGKLLTHVLFHPVQKSLNRLLQIDYTVRIQSISGYSA